MLNAEVSHERNSMAHMAPTYFPNISIVWTHVVDWTPYVCVDLTTETKLTRV